MPLGSTPHSTELDLDEKRYPLPRAVIFDDTVALALGAGNSMASRLVVEAEKDPALRVYIPALGLAAAERERAGVAERLGALPSVDVEGLDFSAAAAVGKRLRMADPADEGKDEPDWSGAHVLHLALPTVVAARASHGRPRSPWPWWSSQRAKRAYRP